MKNNLVVQSNDLVMATYQMERKDKELILACISQIDSRPNAPIVTKQTKFTVSVDTIKSLFYSNPKKAKNAQNLYRDLERASQRLYDVDVFIDLEDDKKLRTRFISGILFDPENDQITLTFAEDILPYLTQLQANFTQYKLLEVGELSSKHSIRLYELIVMWVNQFTYKKEFTLDEFRSVMNVEGSYKQFSQLRNDVIEKAIEEINEKTKYTVKVEYLKKGKGKGFKSLKLHFYRKTLKKLADKDGTLSQEKIESIVKNQQFMNDYNNHPSLSHNAKMNTEVFWREMTHIIQREPETFNKPGKGLESYLAPIKNGS